MLSARVNGFAKYPCVRHENNGLQPFELSTSISAEDIATDRSFVVRFAALFGFLPTSHLSHKLVFPH
jgi:hypothetical protein